MSSINQNIGRSKREDFDVPLTLTFNRFEPSGEQYYYNKVGGKRSKTPPRKRRSNTEECCNCYKVFCCA